MSSSTTSRGSTGIANQRRSGREQLTGLCLVECGIRFSLGEGYESIQIVNYSMQQVINEALKAAISSRTSLGLSPTEYEKGVQRLVDCPSC